MSTQRHQELIAEIAGLRAALKAYLSAQPQCSCGEHSGCDMGAARAAARRALVVAEAADEPINHE